eukprot:COSAG01_NODE_5685_length_4101_cov_98.783858_3_plen_383_part_00
MALLMSLQETSAPSLTVGADENKDPAPNKDQAAAAATVAACDAPPATGVAGNTATSAPLQRSLSFSAAATPRDVDEEVTPAVRAPGVVGGNPTAPPSPPSAPQKGAGVMAMVAAQRMKRAQEHEPETRPNVKSPKLALSARQKLCTGAGPDAVAFQVAFSRRWGDFLGSVSASELASCAIDTRRSQGSAMGTDEQQACHSACATFLAGPAGSGCAAEVLALLCSPEGASTLGDLMQPLPELRALAEADADTAATSAMIEGLPAMPTLVAEKAAMAAVGSVKVQKKKKRKKKVSGPPLSRTAALLAAQWRDLLSNHRTDCLFLATYLLHKNGYKAMMASIVNGTNAGKSQAERAAEAHARTKKKLETDAVGKNVNHEHRYERI